MPAPREGRRWGLGVGAPPVRKGGKLLTRGEGWGGDRTLCVVTRRRLLASAVCAVVACSVRVTRADLFKNYYDATVFEGAWRVGYITRPGAPSRPRHDVSTGATSPSKRVKNTRSFSEGRCQVKSSQVK